jgi:hypothetical protein
MKYILICRFTASTQSLSDVKDFHRILLKKPLEIAISTKLIDKKGIINYFVVISLVTSIE